MIKELTQDFYGHDLIGVENDIIDADYFENFPFGKELDGTPGKPLSDEYFEKYPFGKNLDGSPSQSWPDSDGFLDLT